MRNWLRKRAPRRGPDRIGNLIDAWNGLSAHDKADIMAVSSDLYIATAWVVRTAEVEQGR